MCYRNMHYNASFDLTNLILTQDYDVLIIFDASIYTRSRDISII